MPSLKSTISVLHDYGQRSTLHGLSHMYQSSDMWRKLFWLVLTFCGCFACTYHIVATVTNYLESPITSVYKEEGVLTEFPDVTICNLKPVAESLLHFKSQRQLLFNHLRNNWNFFDDWVQENRRRLSNESRVDYKERLRKLFKLYMDVFWVSDDTRDFGLSDTHMLLSCHYKGNRCNSSSFKLIQHNRYWNCYDFIPPASDRFIDSSDWESGLNLILFTDSNFEQDVLADYVSYERKKSRADEIQYPYSLEEYLTAGERTLNQVLTGNSLEPEGLRVLVHLPNQHPMTANVAYDIANGASTTIEFSMTQQKSMNRPPDNICNEEAPEKIKYVKYFGDSSKNVGTKGFIVNQGVAVVELKQQFIKSKCGCYSHLYPFSPNTSVLCYYANGHERHRPSPDLLKRIRCHDSEYKHAERMTQDLMVKTKAHKPCTRWKIQASKVDVPWPRGDEIIDFANYILLPKFANKDRVKDRPHHILRNSNISRSSAVLKNLFNESCRPNQNISRLDSWCLSRKLLDANVARVWIKPYSAQAGVYEESYSYDWPEALSEVGGIFGLWMGISLLSVCEFIELICIILTAKSAAPGERSMTGRSPDEMEALLMRLLSREEASLFCEPPSVHSSVNQRPMLAPVRAAK